MRGEERQESRERLNERHRALSLVETAPRVRIATIRTLSPNVDVMRADLEQLVEHVDALAAILRGKIAVWQQECTELPKLILAPYRSDEVDGEFAAAATIAGMSVSEYRMKWIADERDIRTKSIRSAESLLAAINTNKS